MKRSEVFPSTYLSKEDVGHPIRAIISNVAKEEIKTDRGNEVKAVMYFQGPLKPMIVNATNWGICEELFGEDSDLWTGNQIIIYVDPSVMFAGKKIGGVRLKASIAKQTVPTIEAPPVVDEDGIPF